MENINWRCEVCDSINGCSCFCECWLPHNQCCCDMTPEDWEKWGKQIEENK